VRHHTTKIFYVLFIVNLQPAGVHSSRTDFTWRSAARSGWWWDAETRTSAECETAASSAGDGEEQGIRSVTAS